MRSREEEESAQRNEIANRERVLMSQNIQLQSKMLKVVAMEVDQQLEKMKATESALQYQFAKAFLPERGFQVDTESLRVILAAKRIAAKANIIKTQVQKLNTPESIIAQLQSADSNAEDAKSPDAIIHALKVEEQLTILANVAADFEDTIAQCDVELYVKLGKLVYDIEPCERTLDILLTLVRDEEFGSGYSVAELEVCWWGMARVGISLVEIANQRAAVIGKGISNSPGNKPKFTLLCFYLLISVEIGTKTRRFGFKLPRWICSKTSLANNAIRSRKDQLFNPFVVCGKC